MSVKIANEILIDAIKRLDISALEQIAKHCQTAIDLSKKYASQDESLSAASSFVTSPIFYEVKTLAACCQRIALLKELAN